MRARLIAKNPLVFAFPWLEIRKNEAYPVFTNASSDNKAPWLNPSGSDPSGQINAFFRWKNIEDTPDAFAIELRLLKDGELPSKLSLPTNSVADVSLRRLQQFRHVPGKMYAWELTRDGKPDGNGTVQADASGLLTIPKLTITQIPAVLRLKAR